MDANVLCEHDAAAQTPHNDRPMSAASGPIQVSAILWFDLVGENLVHGAGGLGAAGGADDAGRDAGDRHIMRHLA
jgi:hypothetical protein